MTRYDDGVSISPDELLRLLRACASGDEAAREEFCRRYEPVIRAHLRLPGFALGSGDIDEIVQSFWEKQCQNEFSFLLRYELRPGARFETYLLVVVRRFEQDWLGKEAHHRKLFDHGDVEWAVDSRSTPEQFHRAEVLIALLWRHLTPLEQQVLDLSLRGYCPADIAKEIQKKPNHVYQIRDGIRQKARRFLGLEE